MFFFEQTGRLSPIYSPVLSNLDVLPISPALVARLFAYEAIRLLGQIIGSAILNGRQHFLHRTLGPLSA
jgi:hypothetical protein